jgi:hypothetical protein
MTVPERWQEVIDLALAPIAWIPRMQEALIAFFTTPTERWTMALKYIFLLIPALLAVAAVWITMLSVYTLPFRASRVRYVSMMLLAWWDAARAVWLYWVGVARVAAVAVGWVVTMVALAVRLVLAGLRQVLSVPLTMTGRVTATYVPPGVPWVAFVMLLAWCVLEATVFTYTMLPTVGVVLGDLAGETEPSRLLGGLLFAFLLLLVMGSFACLRSLFETLRKREFKFLAQMVLIEILVMFFEVMFLYRQFVDAMTPWIAQETGVVLGFRATMSLAAFGWVGVRAMTWFLFAQYGTTPLLAFIARRPLADVEAPEMFASVPGVTPAVWWRSALDDFKHELQWVHGKGEQLLEYLALPALQLLAVGLNFAMMIVASRPAFNLPFHSMKDVTDTHELLATFHLTPRKQPGM